jgi:asparagine synthase (glutamine-hydrolysing)
VAYWSAEQAIESATRLPPGGGTAAMVDLVEGVLLDSVAARLVSDVPIGALLSGGIDSSLVVALMQRHSARPVRTFTVGFGEEAFDESTHAAAVAAHLKTDHTAVQMTHREVFDTIPRLAEVWDEPFADSSQLPTLLVAGVARRSVKVALTGDGGDELFAGYNRHAWLPRLWRVADPIPATVRRGLGGAVRIIPPWAIDALAGALPSRWQVRLPASKAAKVGRVIGAASAQDAYLALISHWEDPTTLVRGSVPGSATSDRRDGADSGWSASVLTDRLLRTDLVTYLPDDILTKVDRAAMAVSLETRTPFLDRAVLEVAWRLPPDMKVRDGTTKWILRQVLDRHVPRSLVDRPKMGFGVPLDSWLRGALRPWAEDLLSEGSLARHGLLEPAPVRRAWRQHLSGHRNFGPELWDVLMLEAWMERWAR